MDKEKGKERLKREGKRKDTGTKGKEEMEITGRKKETERE